MGINSTESLFPCAADTIADCMSTISQVSSASKLQKSANFEFQLKTKFTFLYELNS